MRGAVSTMPKEARKFNVILMVMDRHCRRYHRRTPVRAPPSTENASAVPPFFPAPPNAAVPIAVRPRRGTMPPISVERSLWVAMRCCIRFLDGNAERILSATAVVSVDSLSHVGDRLLEGL